MTREQLLAATIQGGSDVNLDAPVTIDTPAGDKQEEPAKPATPDAANEQPEKPADKSKPDVSQDQQPPPPKNPKEAERLEKTWKSVNEEKQRLRQEREKWESEQRELEEFRRSKLTSQHNSEAEQYERIASEFEAEGKSDAATLARQKAREIRVQADKVVEEQRSSQFRAKWNEGYQSAAEANPELYDQDSQLYKATEALIKSEPILQAMPDGIPKAVQFVKMQMAASRAADLEAKLAEKEARIKELTSKMSLGGESTGTVSGEKSFDQMTQAEKRDYLFRMAKSQDK